MQGKHTPGPWTACEQRSREGWIDIASPGGFLIGQVMDLYTTETPGSNAALIAAAPCMYEACEEAEKYISDPPCGASARPVLAKLRAALAKAQARTGGERGEG